VPRRRNVIILAGLSGLTWLVAASMGSAAIADRANPSRSHRCWAMKVTDGRGWTLVGAAMSFDHPVAARTDASGDQQQSWAMNFVLAAAGRSVEAGLAIETSTAG